MSLPDRINGDTNIFRVQDRIATAIELYRDGHTWEDIAHVVGYSSRGAAHTAVMDYMRKNTADQAHEMRAIENRRMDADEMTLRQIIADRDLSAHERIAAVSARTRLSARRARLNGLDAPVQVEITTGATAEVEDALALFAEVVETVEGRVVARVDEPADDPADDGDGPTGGAGPPSYGGSSSVD